MPLQRIVYPPIESSAHKNPAIEWWFVHGYYENSSIGRRFFMASIFKVDTAWKNRKPRPGFTLLVSVLDPVTGENQTLSQIDTPTLTFLCRAKNDKRTADLDAGLVEAYVNEIKEYGPPLPVRLERKTASINYDPLKIRWDSFSLAEREHAFCLSFREPLSGRKCMFEFTPRCRRIAMDKASSSRFNALDYVTYPSLELSGSVDGREARGQAWLDHQWGDFGGWFINRPGGDKLMGWDWFGINLDNGEDLLVMVHRQMQKNKPMAQFALHSKENECPRIFRNLEVTPLRYWESKATSIKYPIAWRINIPELKCRLTYEPLADDQEIRVFGFTRAIWEGAGTVSGTTGGEKVSGRARLELFGYGFIFDFKNYTERLIRRFDKTIEDFLPRKIGQRHLEKYAGPGSRRCDASAYTQILSQPLWDLLSRPGKHWRSIFSVLMLEAIGKSFEPYESLVVVIPELIHGASLIVDDIEDNSTLRREDKCIHLRYGLDIALNAANAAYFLPHLIISEHPLLSESQKLELFRIMLRQFSRAHLGQGQDIFWSKNMNMKNLIRWLNGQTRGRILQMYAYKTAAMVEGLTESASVIAETGYPLRKACASFGRSLGIAFQIIDDLSEIAGDSPDDGPGGEDILSGKLTYVVLRAMQNLKGTRRRRLQEILCAKKTSRANLKEGLDLIRSSGAPVACRRFAQGLVAKEWRRLSGYLPPSEPKIMLRLLCAKLLQEPSTP